MFVRKVQKGQLMQANVKCEEVVREEVGYRQATM